MKDALLLGVSRFESPAICHLPRVPEDLALLSEALRSPAGPAFDEVCIEGDSTALLTAAMVRESLERFLAPTSREGGGRLRLVYLSSHAWVDASGELHVLCADHDPALPFSSSVPITFLASCLQRAPADSTVIVLDCCFADVGAWGLFERRPNVFSIPVEQHPDHCVIASSRATEPSIDGAFAKLFAEALLRVEPASNQPGQVSIDAIYDYVAVRLRDRHYQSPRLWQSRAVTIPIGRRHRGMRATREAVQELYEAAPAVKLEPPPDASPLDFVETQTTPKGFIMRTGLRVMDEPESLAAVRDAVAGLAAAVKEDIVDNAVLITTDAAPYASLSTQRVRVHSLESFRRLVLPLVQYLETWVKEYEEEPDGVHRRNCYVSVRARPAESDEEFNLDAHLLNWAGSPATSPLLAVLGEFGAGKTTTMRRIFWEQARRYFASPSHERLPIFITLRQFEKAIDIETLIERTLRRQGVGRDLDLHDITEMNRDGRLLWLLDGFDEMALRVTQAVLLQNFEQLVSLAVPESKLVLTCRTAFFKSQEEVRAVLAGPSLQSGLGGAPGYKTVYVQPLTEEDIAAFVRATAPEPEKFLDRLRSAPQILNLASRPLLLEMVVLSLPEMKEKARLNYANLYRHYTARLLRRESWKQAIATGEDRTRFCQALAWNFFTKSTYEITYRELPAVIKSLFPEMAREAEEFDALTRAVQSTTFLARDESGATFSFAHKSFMEFFAASYILERVEEHDLSVLDRRVIPLEILRFLGELAGESEPATSALAPSARPATFSWKYFLPHYLAPRMLPLLPGRPVTSPVQRGKLHRLLHLVLPVVAILVTGIPAGAIVLGENPLWWMWVGLLAIGFVGTTLATAATHLAVYGIKVRLGVEGDPVRRFNAAAATVVAGSSLSERDVAELEGQLPRELLAEARRVKAGIFHPDRPSETLAEPQGASHAVFSPLRTVTWLLLNAVVWVVLASVGIGVFFKFWPSRTTITLALVGAVGGIMTGWMFSPVVLRWKAFRATIAWAVCMAVLYTGAALLLTEMDGGWANVIDVFWVIYGAALLPLFVGSGVVLSRRRGDWRPLIASVLLLLGTVALLTLDEPRLLGWTLYMGAATGFAACIVDRSHILRIAAAMATAAAAVPFVLWFPNQWDFSPAFAISISEILGITIVAWKPKQREQRADANQLGGGQQAAAPAIQPQGTS